MSATPVTPVAGITSQVTVGGSPVDVIPPGPNGGYIVNPYNASDQGLGAAEWLYGNVVTAATLEANGTTVGIAPGQSFTIVPGQTTPVSVNAASSGHNFTVVWW